MNPAPIDLVVLDLMLPQMSGYEICRTLRRLDTEIPIMALTARMLSKDKVQAFDVGVDQYMTKPFSLPELLSRVNTDSTNDDERWNDDPCDQPKTSFVSAM